MPSCFAHLAWGVDSARSAADHGHIVVIVDTLSFSTVVAHAASNGARIYPAATRDDASLISRETGAELAVRRIDVPSRGRFSLSPLTYVSATLDTRVALFSPNGGRASLAAQHAPLVLAGALVNATAVACHLAQHVVKTPVDITIVACGERMGPSGEEVEFREAVEDYLGAGAVLAALGLSKSDAAADCAAAFVMNRAHIANLLMGSFSALEFAGTTYVADVLFASRIDSLDVAPVLHSGPHPFFV